MRAITYFLRPIPAHDTLQMRAQRRELMHTPVIILVHRNRRFQPSIQHTTLAIRQVLDVVDVALQEALVLAVDLQIVREHGTRGLDEAADAGGLVELGPGVAFAFDFVGDDARGEHAVREAVAGVAGDDEGVLGARVAANEGDVVDGLEDLAGPGVVDCAYRTVTS